MSSMEEKAALLYHLGHFAQCLALKDTAGTSPVVDTYRYLSAVASGNAPSAVPPSCKVLQAPPAVGSKIASPHDAWLAGESWARRGLWEDAIRTWLPHANHPEVAFWLVVAYLAWNRVDLAQKECAVMNRLGDESVWTLMAEVLTAYHQGADKVQDGFYILTEWIETHQATPLLHTLLAVTAMHGGRWEEAERHLLDALQLDKNDARARQNLKVTAVHLRRPQDATLAALKEMAGQAQPNELQKEVELKASWFDRCAAAFH